jgi:glycosyltransferase involved in cell wall biosynthesis
MKEKVNPLVSIVVPAYNCENYIEECITRILDQTYQNIQIIIVDDGSEDRTFELCKAFSDSRITLLQQKNGGASSARNNGLNHVIGEYILFADSDDYLETDAVSCLIALTRKDDADLIYFEADNFSQDSNIPIKAKGFSQSRNYQAMSGNELIPQLIRNRDYHAAPFLFFIKRDVMNKGLRFKEGIMMEDELFSFQLFRSCERVVCLRRELYHRRVRPGSVMTSPGKEEFRYYSIQTVFQELLKEWTRDSSDVTLKIYLSRIGMLLVGYWEQLPTEKRKPLQKQYELLRQLIREENGFGSSELVVRTFGKVPWVIYVLPDRVVKRIKKHLG